MRLTHNTHIKTLENATHHLELEEERLHFSKLSTNVYIAASSSQGGKGCKSKNQGGNQQGKGKGETNKKQKTKKRKAPPKKKKKNISKVKCFNCGNNGHFARDYIKPKKTQEPQTM